jgi:hypothetical protein
MPTSQEMRVQNTFDKAMDQINRLQKVFRDEGGLAKAVVDVGGSQDFGAIQEAFDNLYGALEDAHYDAMASSQVESVKQKLGLAKDMTEGRLGFKDIAKFGSEKASRIDQEARRRGSADMEPGDADELRYKIAKEMGLIEDAVKQKLGMTEDPSKPNFPMQIELAGDSIWDRDEPNPRTVTVTDYNIDKDEEGYISVTVEHDGPWTVYTDSGFEEEISDMIGMEVSFSEQGMQEDGVAHLEGGEAMESNELSRLKQLIGHDSIREMKQ